MAQCAKCCLLVFPPFLLVCGAGLCYILLMDVVVKFIPSAFKHGFTETNIRHAILNFKYDDVFDDEHDKHLLIGFDNNANLLEIMYNVIDEQNIKVFHAMKCRNAFFPLLKE